MHVAAAAASTELHYDVYLNIVVSPLVREVVSLDSIWVLAVEVGAWIEFTDVFFDVFIRRLQGTLGFIKSYQSVNVKFIEHP